MLCSIAFPHLYSNNNLCMCMCMCMCMCNHSAPAGAKAEKMVDSFAVSRISEPVTFQYDIEVRTIYACASADIEPEDPNDIVALLQPMSRGCLQYVCFVLFSTLSLSLALLLLCAQLTILSSVLCLLTVALVYLFQNTGWWTYEYCHLKGIRQFHMESSQITSITSEKDKNGKPVQKKSTRTENKITVEFSLGKLSPKIKNTRKKLKQAAQVTKRTTVLETYASLPYADGTECDLTGLFRSTQVRFFCDDSGHDRITSVVETATCEYVMNIGTARVCNHADFLPDPPRVQVLTCRPIENPQLLTE
jgi:Glucosidase II beta subunit-like protein